MLPNLGDARGARADGVDAHAEGFGGFGGFGRGDRAGVALAIGEENDDLGLGLGIL